MLRRTGAFKHYNACELSKLGPSRRGDHELRTTSDMDKLPVEILSVIISMLQPGDLKRFRLAKRLWEEVSFPAFMKHLVVHDTPERLCAFQAFLRSAGVTWTEHITILPSSCYDGGLTSMAPRSDRFLFLRQLPRLQQLTICPKNPAPLVTAQYPLDIVQSMSVLREVSIYTSLDMGRMREVVCPFVSVLKMDGRHAPPARRLTSFVNCFPALRHLSLSFQDASAAFVFRVLHWPRLSSLELTGFRIHGQDLVGFLRRHPELQNVILQDFV